MDVFMKSVLYGKQFINFSASDLEIRLLTMGKSRLSLFSLCVQSGKLIPSSVVMENMIALTAQAQRELRVARRELQRYRSLNLTPEQRDHLENFVSRLIALKPSSRIVISLRFAG